MTTHYGAGVLPEKISEDVLSNQEASDVLIPMGCVSSSTASERWLGLTDRSPSCPLLTLCSITSENVAKDYGITREEQDRFAAESFRRAEHAQNQGWFKEEIVPVKVRPSRPFTLVFKLTGLGSLL